MKTRALHAVLAVLEVKYAEKLDSHEFAVLVGLISIARWEDEQILLVKDALKASSLTFEQLTAMARKNAPNDQLDFQGFYTELCSN